MQDIKRICKITWIVSIIARIMLYMGVFGGQLRAKWSILNQVIQVRIPLNEKVGPQ